MSFTISPGADFPDIESIAVAAEHCHRCGSAIERRELERDELGWSAECEHYLSRVPVPAVRLVIYDDERVLVLDEPIPQHEGLWSLPGGFASRDERPREAGVRELSEETGLRADLDDLRSITIQHASFEEVSFYLISSAVERAKVSGDVVPEADGFEVRFRPVEGDLSAEDRMRATDRERIRMAVGG